MSIINGACLCGKLCFSVPLPTLWVAHCHCTLCQKNSGAAFVTWAGFQEQDVQIDDSNQTLKWFSATENAYRGFCKECGSTIFFKSARWPGELHITVVNIHETLDCLPQVHVHWDSHQPWIDLADELPRKAS
jgi:hypothetical protein